MCEIAGIYNKNGMPEDRAVIERMSLAIEHRGPDEESFHLDNHVHLASRRLSIIDLSAGKQTIYNIDHSRCIVYNGEIYTYQSLKKELSSRGHVFKTNTDTEVVLLAYEEWGEKCLNRFKGMFSICLWDLKKKELSLARDRLGIKPFYFADLENGTFVFASEIKAVLKHPEVKKPSTRRR
jgi:asparagine synthase (glutamine-hydrolysing)